MADVSRHVNAPPDRVWAQLSDGWMYTGWVVGASHIRDVDSEWPQVGTRLHHQVGAWPVTINDTTHVVECEPERRLVLQARAWPVGEALIVIELEADGDGTNIRMHEQPTHGAGRWVHNPLQDLILAKRNVESLARLASIAERRPVAEYRTTRATSA